MKIASIQIGKVVTEGDPDTRDVTRRLWSSAFDKRPVDGAVQVGPLGIEGDEVADHKHHGGVEKAVLCYSSAHYPAWGEDYPDLNLSAGGFGENLTIEDADETSVCIGDRWLAGTCVMEVCQPRQPCWKIARRHADKTLTKAVAQTGRTGWYVRVVVVGSIRPGDELERIKRPQPDWTIARVNDLLLNRDEKAIKELLDVPELSDQWKKDLPIR